MERLPMRVLAAADAAGMVVIVSYFYWKQALRFTAEAAIRRATADLSDWLLACGHRNVLVEIVNECLLSATRSSSRTASTN